jgi:Reverse transcriptase-like
MDLTLIQQIKELLSRKWKIQIKLISRKANCCADLLAKKALEQELGFNILISMPSDLHFLLYVDMCGTQKKVA